MVKVKMSRPRIHSIGSEIEYNCWINMHLRCYKISDKVYYRYGKRGIKVCARWHIFANFYKDMGKRPNGLTLERRNNDEDYNKKNCYWATRKVQCNNRSTNTKILFRNETHNLGEWSKILGIHRNVIKRRHLRNHPLDVPLPGRWD